MRDSRRILYYGSSAGADPGFPVAGDANSLERRVPTYDFAKFSEKLHEIEKIMGCRGKHQRPCIADLMDR